MKTKLFAAIAAGLALCASATAEISNTAIDRYNAAANGADKSELIAAADQLGKEAMASPEAEHATLLAYEAAWAMCRSGACERALPVAEFSAAQPDTGSHPSLADRTLLVAYARWKTAPGEETRSVLDQELDPRVEDAPSLLTVSAFQSRMMDDLSHNRFKRAEKTSAQAARHFYPAREQIGRLWSGAELAAQTSKFNDRQAPEAIVGIAKLQAELHRMRHVYDENPDWLNDRYYTSIAWQTAMNAYFESTKKAAGERKEADRIQKASEEEEHEDTSSPEFSSDKDRELSRCPGGLNRGPRPDYPDGAASDGYIGAVIVLFDVDEKGNIDPRIGASVPTGKFDKSVLRSLRQVKWKWEEPADGEGPCKKEINGAIYPFEFMIKG